MTTPGIPDDLAATFSSSRSVAAAPSAPLDRLPAPDPDKVRTILRRITSAHVPETTQFSRFRQSWGAARLGMDCRTHRRRDSFRRE